METRSFSTSSKSLQGVTEITSQRALELDITYVCNMGCIQCNRVLGVLPSKECLKTVQIEKILQQALELPVPFKEIRILGGEPTLHPQLDDILAVVRAYQLKVADCQVTLWSHGYGKLVQERLRKLPDWLHLQISPKKPVLGGELFEAFLAAPVDYEDRHNQDYAEGCIYIGEGKCGVGFSPFGIYACPVAGAIDRVIGYNLGIKDAKDISTEKFREQCNHLCRYCGHFLLERDVILPKDTISPTWEKLIDSAKNATPLMNRF